jgi:glycosyltransferase involved in cell wall biosynthesis
MTTVATAHQVSGHLRNAATAEADCRGKRIGILIVAYNAVSTLGKVLRRIPASVIENVEEIVVFDDASHDETAELALGYKITNNFEKLTVFKNEVNLGYGGNQKRGYDYFASKGFDIVVLLHGDGQYAPEVLASLYQPIVAGQADAVFGSRMMPNYGGPLRGGMPLYKFVGNRILTTYENWSLGMHLSEFHSGYRAYNLHALRQIMMGAMTDDFHFDTEIIVKLHHQGFRIVERPIPTYYGDELCYVDGVKYARNVYRAVRRYRQTISGRQTHPEFAEYATHYPVKDSLYSSHYWIPRIVGTERQVLDIGCGEGFLAERLRHNRNEVTGIDALGAPRLRHVFRDYFVADLTRGLADVAEGLADCRFDDVLLADVLEHLSDPGRLLDDCRPYLRGTGRLIVSLPNVANLYIRLQLLRGRFDYTPRGILDATHLRFFTRETGRALLERHGYRVIQERSTVIPFELALGVSGSGAAMRLVARIAERLTSLRPTLLGYQHIYVAVPA